MSAKLVACLLNVSEARNYKVLTDIAQAALKDQDNWKPCSLVGQDQENNEVSCCDTSDHVNIRNATNASFKSNSKATVLNIFADVVYNRSVITIASSIEHLEQCLFQACIEAFDKIDLRSQVGGHPRLGAVDLVPIHPLSNSVSLHECGIVARQLGRRITNSIPGTAAFYFGTADLPLKRDIVTRRKDVNWYSGENGTDFSNVKCDIGERPSSRFGLTGIGAMPYMTNFNITVDTNDHSIGNSVARDIRMTSPNGLKGVQSMAFCYNEKIEIACNVETLDLQLKVYFYVNSCKILLNEAYTGPPYATFEEIEDAVRRLCKEKMVTVSERKVIGFKPEEAYERTLKDLTEGFPLHLKKYDNTRM
eukprot:gene9297-10278_t